MPTDPVKLTDKPVATSMASTDHFLSVINGLVRRVTPSATATLLSSLGTFQNMAIRTVSSSSDSPSTTDRILNVNTGSNAVTINFPAASEWHDSNGNTIVMWANNYSGTNAMTLTPNGSETINGASSQAVASGGKIIYSDGSNLFSL